jgi:hypothetical protein
MATMKGSIAVAAGAVLLAMTSGCGEQHSGDPGSDGAGREPFGGRAESLGKHLALDCPTNLRASGTWDDMDGIEGEASPVAVARPFAYDPAGETVTITRNRSRAQAWILRADETARALLNLRYEAEYGGWYLTTFEVCADMSLTLGTGTLPARRLAHGFGYILGPPSGQMPAITEAEAFEAAYHFGLSRYPQLRAAAVRSVYSPDRGKLVDPGDPDSAVIPEFDHGDAWVLAFDAMVPKWGVSQPPGFNKPNPLVPGTAVVFVDAQTGEVPVAVSM